MIPYMTSTPSVLVLAGSLEIFSNGKVGGEGFYTARLRVDLETRVFSVN